MAAVRSPTSSRPAPTPSSRSRRHCRRRQRAVASRPKCSGARMELARAYYAVGDNESARREVTTLQAEAPPPEAARAIAEYLDAIDRRAAAYQRQMAAYVALAGGYDSNVN